ncbi:hypothetical protein, partial [Streptococcus pseudopneumoniae]|uniref:hypothetical protein n=1 Tax=Streptococcus pseudopneumoniae TaxID=257758 RepID=UPI001486B2D7
NNNMPFDTASYPNNMTEREAEDILNYIKSLQNPPVPGEKFIDSSSAYSGLAKAKYIIHGGAPTAADVTQAVGSQGEINRAGLRNLVNGWLNTDASKDKLKAFFNLALDQSEWTYPVAGTFLLGRIRPQGAADNPFRNQFRNQWEQNLKESFSRTALDIVDQNRPFSEIVTS